MCSWLHALHSKIGGFEDRPECFVIINPQVIPPDWDPGAQRDQKEHSGQEGVLNQHGNFFKGKKKTRCIFIFSTVG